MAVIGILAMKYCGPTPDPSKSYRDELTRLAHQHTLDSAETAAAYEAKANYADSLVRVAAHAFDNASRYRKLADSLARLPRYVPTAVVTTCDSALVLTMQERDTLRAGLDTLTHAFQTLATAYRGSVETASLAYTGWMKAEGQLSQERGVWSDEREAWKATVKRLKPCSILGLIGCPVLSVGWGAQLSQGRVTTGPTVSIGIPIRLGH
jgi:hypothetical protein